MDGNINALDQARRFHIKPMLYNCSPSFNWSAKMIFSDRWAKISVHYIGGFHSLNYSMFTLAKSYKANGMSILRITERWVFR